MTRDLVLALDGGGTKTLVGLADTTGKVRILPPVGGVNAFDNTQWRDHLDAALSAAPIEKDRIAGAVIGMPGYGESRKYDEAYRQALDTFLSPDAIVINDVFMAHDGAFAGAQGVLALAGTGAMAVARDAGGRYHRVGGWGHDFGDEGSAYWIGREALKRASWAFDGRSDAKAFQEKLSAAIGAEDPDRFGGLLEWLARLEHMRSGIAGLARQIDAMAEAGEATAQEIMTEAAKQLARQVIAVRERAGLVQDVPWSFAGSVFKSRLVIETLSETLGSAPVLPVLPPLGGGLLGAAWAAGWPVSTSWRDRVREALS